VIRCGDRFQPPLRHRMHKHEYFVLDPVGREQVEMRSMTCQETDERITIALAELVADWRPKIANENPRATVVWVEPTGARA